MEKLGRRSGAHHSVEICECDDDVEVYLETLVLMYCDDPKKKMIGEGVGLAQVAGDDGIRPQTTEAIAHAKSAGVPIIVAINKIDKEGASDRIMQVMQEHSSNGCQPEDWGGNVPMVQISALTGKNVDDLLETTMLVAEVFLFRLKEMKGCWWQSSCLMKGESHPLKWAMRLRVALYLAQALATAAGKGRICTTTLMRTESYLIRNAIQGSRALA